MKRDLGRVKRLRWAQDCVKVGRLAHQLKRFIGGHYVPELLNKGLEGRAVFVVREPAVASEIMTVL